ncbi:MAG TPA: DegT/DnrJ/EryC1/StrS family aminotransferase [Candidatus Competibacter sp.]|nr:DegT/DnrJ/EryC1/StrS family aminotransferase [Candidatus Competibacter sp.]
MRRYLPPVGLPVVTTGGSALPIFPGYCSIWTQRGTAALALALRLAMARRSEVNRPQVLIPGYGCPDLIAAARYAGVEPVLVDIGPDQPGFDLQALDRAWTKSVVAVVAVNCLGIAERLEEVAARTWARNAWLIEDDAQWFPEPSPDAPLLVGDAVVLSFGRGKPVSLLGGGALLLREDQGSPAAENLNVASTEWLLGLKVTLYNRLLQPRWYSLISHNPLLRMGKTRYKPLDDVQAMADQRLGLLGANVAAWLGRDRWREVAIAEVLAGCAGVAVDLPRILWGRARRLLRYPLLCRDRVAQERLLVRLAAAGLGATAMYREALPWVHGVSQMLDTLPALPGAQAFAERLLTLPVHDGVSREDIERMGAVIRAE